MTIKPPYISGQPTIPGRSGTYIEKYNWINPECFEKTKVQTIRGIMSICEVCGLKLAYRTFDLGTYEKYIHCYNDNCKRHRKPIL